jgi:nitrite reductase/ring-hydroxylating ferredoxin subunit/DMSO/TMAO reductase YedYZ heme-binding membrane subunit
MAEHYVAVGWNRQKKWYDGLMLGGVALYLALFIGVGWVIQPYATAETLIIRGLGTCALILLHVILCIGPLCRLDRRFLPLLYNRRHLGVTMFFLAFGHGVFSIIQFHALGDVNPLVSVLISETSYGNVAQFPFQPLGLAALVILLLMAATSHDFWLANLTAPVWKRLHMAVYLAYFLLIGHVSLGFLQGEATTLTTALLGMGMMIVFGLHLASGLKERAADGPHSSTNFDAGFVDVCALSEIPDTRARIVTLAGERVAIFRDGERVSAMSNVCQHQNGPLGEGKVVDGCVTCPWHGYQYRLEDGASPPPFTEAVPTFETRVVEGRVFVNPKPRPSAGGH